MGKTLPHVWVPPFDWLKQLTLDNTQSMRNDGCWCRLCEGFVKPQLRQKHLEIHVQQRADYRRFVAEFNG